MPNATPRGLPCRYCGERTWSRKPSADGTVSHVECRPVHGTVAGYVRGCRCDDCRSANAETQREYRKQVIERDGLSPTQKYRPAKRKRCRSCQKVIRNGHARCAPCADRRRRRRRQALRTLRRAAAGTSSNPNWPWVVGDCRHCGEWFTRKHTPSPYCTGQCRRSDKQGGSQWIAKSERQAIYERDGWTCQLCFDPVDPDLPHTDAWAATLDHIECRAWTDDPDHSPSNLRLAHRWCNSVRGDESYYTEDDLRGVA